MPREAHEQWVERWNDGEYRVAISTDSYKIAWWQKDGAWHVALPFEPSDADRAQYPTTYPKGDSGLFHLWTAKAFDTREQALDYAKGRIAG